MDGKVFRVLLGLMILLMLPAIHAKADKVNAEWVSTTRSLSMGNVGIASAEDPTTAAFYNPAALARAKKASLELFNPQFDLGTGVFSTSAAITDWGKHLTYDASKPLVNAKPGKISSMGFSIFPNITSQNFSFGILGRTHRSSYYDSATSTYHAYSRQLVVPSLGLSMAVLGGRVRIGAAVRAIQINEMSGKDTGNIATTTLATQEGLGIGLDGGLLITMPWAWLPTIGAVARNIGDTAFPNRGLLKLGGKGTVTVHDKIKMIYDGGFSLSPRFGQRSVMVLAVDYRDVLNKTGVNDMRHINAGFEIGMSKKLFLRGGISQGYWTAGLGLASKEGAFDFGTYADELHATGFQVVEDRKISFRITRIF